MLVDGVEHLVQFLTRDKAVYPSPALRSEMVHRPGGGHGKRPNLAIADDFLGFAVSQIGIQNIHAHSTPGRFSTPGQAL
jgi:hypothetical protein